MTNSPSTMPGAFSLHQPRRDNGNASAPRLSGAKSHIFQPPRTPSGSAASSMILSKSTTSIISNSTSLAAHAPSPLIRKRTLDDYHNGTSVESGRTPDEWEVENYSERRWPGGEDWMPASPKPFVNTRYQLAGGLDSPSLAVENMHDTRNDYSDMGYRRSLGDAHYRPDANGKTLFAEQEAPGYFALEREANGRGRGYAPGHNNNAWSKGAISVVGAVVGKAWEFCKAGATVFTGFRSGGGQAYKVEHLNSAARFEAVENENNWESEKIDCERGDREGTPVPGQFPEDDFIADYMDNPTPETTPMRPSKRRQTSGHFREEESRTWVVVNQPTPSATPPKSQHIIQPRYPMKANRSPVRRSMSSNNRPASRVGLSALNRQNTLPRVSHAGSPALQSSRGASFASPRSPASGSRIPRMSPMREVKNGGLMVEESPAAREAKRWKAAKRKEEREADESIRRLDAQLKAMIREGKEALGTKIEVELEDDD